MKELSKKKKKKKMTMKKNERNKTKKNWQHLFLMDLISFANNPLGVSSHKSNRTEKVT